MTDVLQGLVTEAKKNKFSSIVPSLTEEDIVAVWDNVSALIEKQMQQSKGVNIPGFGTFTFSQKKLDVGSNKFLLIQRPVFILSEKFSQTHGLAYTKHHTEGAIPVVPLNYAALSHQTPYSRDTVESCVRELLGALSRSVHANRNVEFAFSSIGRFSIRNGKVKMRFYKEFINSMDGSGQMEASLRNGNDVEGAINRRPGTPDSVMTNATPRPETANTLILPRLSHGRANKSMPTIEEDREVQDVVNASNEVGVDAMETKEPGDNEAVTTTRDHPTPPPPSRQPSRTSLPIALATDFTVEDVAPRAASNLQRSLSLGGVPNSPHPPTARKSLSPLNHTPNVVGLTPRPFSFTRSHNIVNDANDVVNDAQAIVNDARMLMRDVGALEPPQPPPAVATAAWERDEKQLQSSPPATAPLQPREDVGSAGAGGEKMVRLQSPGREQLSSSAPLSPSCGHNAGQELCYLCHQRARRNIPVDFGPERRRREKEEDKLLQQYQHLKDTENIIREQETVLAKRHDSQKVAAFNQGVSEALRQRHVERPRDYHPSYLFQKRPLTPPRHLKQVEYFKDLSDQVSIAKNKALNRRDDEDFLGRLEQVQLAEDLAVQREQYMKDKADQQEMYKRALSAQIQVRNTTHDCNDELLPMQFCTCSSRIRSCRRIGPLPPMTSRKHHRSCPILKFKPQPLPSKYPDSAEPYFGVNDITEAKVAERRKRANELYKEQVGIVEQRKRDAILRKLQEQQEEGDVLKRVKKELLEDRADRFQRIVNSRRRLETDWATAAEEKRHFEKEERDLRMLGGHLVHEQCDKYKRCEQCRRRVNNCGESNIWRESRYIPGSRLMV